MEQATRIAIRKVIDVIDDIGSEYIGKEGKEHLIREILIHVLEEE